MFEFIIGGFFGVYMAQSCVLPNIQDYVTKWVLNRNGPITPNDAKEDEEEEFTGQMPKIPTEIEMTRVVVEPIASGFAK